MGTVISEFACFTDLATPIEKIVTRGSKELDSWVSQFYITYSKDSGSTYKEYKGLGSTRVSCTSELLPGIDPFLPFSNYTLSLNTMTIRLRVISSFSPGDHRDIERREMREHAKSGARTKKARGGRSEGEKEKEQWRLQTTHC